MPFDITIDRYHAEEQVSCLRFPAGTTAVSGRAVAKHDELTAVEMDEGLLLIGEEA